MCDTGYFGQFCDHNSYCSESTCKNGGVCDQYDWLYNACDCTGTGFHGEHCQTSGNSQAETFDPKLLK